MVLPLVENTVEKNTTTMNKGIVVILSFLGYIFYLN